MLNLIVPTLMACEAQTGLQEVNDILEALMDAEKNYSQQQTLRNVFKEEFSHSLAMTCT